MWTHSPHSGIFWCLFFKGLGGGLKIELQSLPPFPQLQSLRNLRV